MSQPPPDTLAVVRQQTGEWLTEVQDLRKQASRAMPADGAPPDSYASALRTLRPLLDRIEEIHALAISLAGGAKRAAAEANGRMQEAWDAQATKPEGPRAGRDYEGAQERYARWNLAILPQRREARYADHASGMAADAERQIRLHHQGVEGMRQELIPVLRFLQWVTSTEQ